MTQIESTWRYGQVKSNALNVRREPSRKARRWNNVWPMNRLVLVKPGGVDGWYETLYRGEPAYVMAEFIKLLDDPVPNSIVERMMFMALPDNGRSKSIYFNGYNGKWCHRFADWLAMNAGMPKEMIPCTLASKHRSRIPRTFSSVSLINGSTGHSHTTVGMPAF